jgi:hypothetical protein
MTENVENLILEHLKALRAEMANVREHIDGVLVRLGNLEVAVARIGRDIAHTHSEQVEDRHAMDRLRERVTRIERRLELNS